MNGASLALMLAAPVLLVTNGYFLAARLVSATPAQRLAVALLAGLLLLQWNLGIANLVAPIDRLVALACLWPVLLTLFLPAIRVSIRKDVLTIAKLPAGRVGGTLILFAVVLVAWPELTEPDLLYYDGTSSHDGYFWITGAKHLQQHTVLELAAVDRAHPWDSVTRAICGWRPEWGRAGAEALLAFTASLTHLDVVAVYLPVTAALLLPWLAAVYLAARAFWVDRLNVPALVALVLLQPFFFFFRANGNLPNLLGALAGGLVVVSTYFSLHATAGRGNWLLLLALGLHGLLFSYPEMAPFIALPCVLLVGRAFLLGNPEKRHAARLAIAGAALGLVLNPATSVRAFHGFIQSFKAGRADNGWANLFERLDPTQYPAALATLATHAFRFLGSGFGLFATLVLLGAFLFALARARDRFAATASLSGGALLLVYTLVTSFNYGWQKTSQFAAVFIAAALPVSSVGALASTRSFQSPRFRWLCHALAGAVFAIFTTSLVFHALDARKWQTRKFITREWLDLAEASRTLGPAPVLIDPATFPVSFFNGMWATYYLREHPLTFAARGWQNGGYVRDHVLTETETTVLAPGAILVSRAWADTFDANSPRIFASAHLALLKTSNRVTALEGILPREGMPTTLLSRATLEVRPHSRSELYLTLAPTNTDTPKPIRWRLTYASSAGQQRVTSDDSGPWSFRIPLAPNESNRIELVANDGSLAPDVTFKVVDLRVTTTP